MASRFAPLGPGDPRQAGGYSLRARLGAGGMGQVYLSFTPGGRPLAIKVIRPEHAEDEEFRRRFQREVTAAQRVQGLYTAPVVDADPDAPLPWLATAYVPGPSLHKAVTEHGPLPAPTVFRLLAGVAEGLAAVHACGVIHRDLTPANVLLAEDGPRVIDFGIAHAAAATSLTGVGMKVGTPAFMAPEQAQGRSASPATDVFGLGQLAVFAATGRPAFGEGNQQALLYRIINQDPDLTGCPQDVRAIAVRCLAKDPAERPDVAEVMGYAREQTRGQTMELAQSWLPAAIAGSLSAYHTAPYRSTAGDPAAGGKTQVTGGQAAEHLAGPGGPAPQWREAGGNAPAGMPGPASPAATQAAGAWPPPGQAPGWHSGPASYPGPGPYPASPGQPQYPGSPWTPGTAQYPGPGSYPGPGGQPFQVQGPSYPAPPYPPPGAQWPYGAGPHPPGPLAAGRDPSLAERWRRLLARLIDALAVALLSLPIWVPAFTAMIHRIQAIAQQYPGGPAQPGAQAALDQAIFAFYGVTFLLAALQAVIAFGYDWLQHGLWGQTLGKRALGTKVVTARDRSRITGGAAAGRAAVYALIAAVPFIGGLFALLNELWLLWDPRRQCLHDKAAGTVVVKVGSLPSGARPPGW